MGKEAADYGLLSPVWAKEPVAGATGDAAVVGLLLEAELAWAETLEHFGLAGEGAAREFGDVVRSASAGSAGAFDAARLAESAQGGGNPVIPLVRELRELVQASGARAAASAVHRGLTSQDVLDTALMMLSSRVVRGVCARLEEVATSLATLAAVHRTTPQVARTLGQHSLPSSFGLKAANWLQGVEHALRKLTALDFPVQCGGAAGTNASLVALGGDPSAFAEDWAGRCGLQAPVAPWQSARGAVTEIGDALAEACAAAGRVANDVLLLSRPEIGELAEPRAAGRGVSSAMPQKQNPALSVLIRSAAISAPAQAMELRLASALGEDERSGGAWHAEWPALRQLLRLALGSTGLLAELCGGLEVRSDRMLVNLRLGGPLLLSERIMLALAERARGGRAGIQRCVDASLATSDLTAAASVFEEALLAEVPGLEESELRGLLDPAGYQGDAAGLVDRIVARHRAAQSRRAANDRDERAEER